MSALVDWLWLLIWVLGIVAWLVARERDRKRPYLWLIVAFLAAGTFNLVLNNI